jgi:hypothetical protein
MWAQNYYYGEDQTLPDRKLTSYCTLFAEEMNSLYLLSLLLTADHDTAMQCFLTAMGECADKPEAPLEWARPSARWAVVRQAMKMMLPAPDSGKPASFLSLGEAAAWDNPLAGILSLKAFERFVFVMSVLEGQSDRDCAILLHCSRNEVTMARMLATECLAYSDGVLQA